MNEEATKPIRIWAMLCPFKKSGFPVLGSFGKEHRSVVILTTGAWQQLCREVPELATKEFEVGIYD